LPAVSSRLLVRTTHPMVAIVGLTVIVSCSGKPASPTPQPAPGPTAVPPDTHSSTALLWPLPGRDGPDWVINNYVDLDATSGTLDYTGGTGSEAKTYNGHTGLDLAVRNSGWVMGVVPTWLSAGGGLC